MKECKRLWQDRRTSIGKFEASFKHSFMAGMELAGKGRHQSILNGRISRLKSSSYIL
jgi:hypothetical protein